MHLMLECLFCSFRSELFHCPSFLLAISFYDADEGLGLGRSRLFLY